jgi:hypothetical protein
MKLDLQPRHYYYLTFTSNFTLLSIYYSYKLGFYIETILCTCLLLTSLNYWRYPTLGFRRNLDRFFAVTSVTVQTFHLRNQPAFYQYILLAFISIYCYRISNYCNNKKMINLSVFFHSMIHLLGNVANIILYTF